MQHMHIQAHSHMSTEIHKGGHSTVIVREDVAVKIITLGKCKEAIGECMIMAMARHDCVMRPLNIQMHEKCCTITMPAGKVLNAFGLLPTGDVLRWSAGLTSAVAYLHSRGIIHCDIKPDNIIICGGVPKLADFGIAMMQNERYTQGWIQTVWYRAVEVEFATKHAVAPSIDVYALGCVLYEMVSGQVLMKSDCDDTSIVYAKVMRMSPLVLKTREERLRDLMLLTRHGCKEALLTHARTCLHDVAGRLRLIAELDALGWWDMVATMLLMPKYRAGAEFASALAHSCAGLRYREHARWQVPTCAMDEMKCLRVDIRAWKGMTLNEYNLAEFVLHHVPCLPATALFIANCVYQQRESAWYELTAIEPNVIAKACEAVTAMLQLQMT
jgi:Protein kinase domain